MFINLCRPLPPLDLAAKEAKVSCIGHRIDRQEEPFVLLEARFLVVEYVTVVARVEANSALNLYSLQHPRNVIVIAAVVEQKFDVH